MMVLGLVLGCGTEKLGQAPKGGNPDASVGAVTFQIAIPETASFCDQIAACAGAPAHIAITDSAGRAYNQTAPYFCYCNEATCLQSCLTIFCGGPGWGVPVTTVNQVWSGTYYAASDRCGSTCGDVAHYLPPGAYVAQLCATPGTMSTTDGGTSVCTNTGVQLCGSPVPFTFPSTTPIVLTLPASGGAVTIDTR